jgi:tetratricopeptide (TPR) repeat protein
LQYRPGVTSTVAILALLALAPPLALTKTAERIPLPVARDALTLRIHPFEKSLRLEVPPAAVAAVAKRLKGASRLCPVVESGLASVTLRCKSNRLRADLDLNTAEPTLDLRALTIYPWRPEEEGPPFVPLDLEALGLGSCPGDSPEARGECLLAEGKLQEALDQFAEAARGPRLSPLAALRLGDLALASDEPELAMEHWRRANQEFPFGRLVMARLCEMDPRCMKGEERRALLDASRVAEPVRHDVFIRAIRLRLLDGEKLTVVRDLIPEMTPDGACAGPVMMTWCRRFLLDLLRGGGPDAAEALAMFLELPGRAEGPLSAELYQAAADQAEAAGAPIFAANMLAVVSGRVPEADQPAHLHRVASLFLRGGDRARAEEIVLFARGHLDRATWKRDGWEALQRSLRRPAPVAVRAAEPTDPDIAAARTAVESARLLQLAPGARP